MKHLVICLALLGLAGCASMGMDSCKVTCGLHGVKVYNHETGTCECANMGTKFNNSFNNRNSTPSDLQSEGLDN
jgi:hypothetical protein